jgi:hypothetical protein
VLIPGSLNTWQWTNSYTGEQSGAIQIQAGLEYPDEHRVAFGAARWTPGVADHVRLIYSRSEERFDYAVWLERTPQHYGGHRIWWRCPRCQQRRAVIYGVASDGRFGCRGCMHLAYSSEADDVTGRSWRATRKLARRLGSDEHAPQVPPPKPKGMHQRTYERLCGLMWAQEERRDAALWAFTARHWPEVAELLK